VFRFIQYPRYGDLNRIFPEVESGSNVYLRSYPRILEVTKTLRDDDFGSSITFLAHAAYGWMPTVLKSFEAKEFFLIDQNPITAIRNTKNCESLIAKLPDKSPVNNSWIGLSKVLHFINPKVFPIWDSRVARHFGLNSNTQYNNKKCYVSYANWITDFNDKYDFDFLKSRILEKYGYSISGLRAAELSLFLSSNQEKFYK